MCIRDSDVRLQIARCAEALPRALVEGDEVLRVIPVLRGASGRCIEAWGQLSSREPPGDRGPGQ
eukprot:13106162-Alexandrium_andersonii.AAC.1